MTLKTVLKNFLNYADTLEAQKKLGKDLYEIDFQKLKALTEELKHDPDHSTSEGLEEVNRRKNRYKDILPYNHTRVVLSEYPGVPGSDYINANYIKGASGSLAYIASQGPLPNTVVDFWRMIWECEVQVIVMACNERESGKYKCECYWPTDEEKKQYGNISVEFVKWRQVCPDFLVRTLRARSGGGGAERVLCQFHYATWPDHGVPPSVTPILELVRLVRDCQASEAVPVLVHCSAGCGRTGTICAIDFVWGLMRTGKLSEQFNLFEVIADMRRQRIAMVQTKEQYVLVHRAVSSLFEQQLRVIDSHTYENLDEDGEPLLLSHHHQEEDIYEDILEPAEIEVLVSKDKFTPRKVLKDLPSEKTEAKGHVGRGCDRNSRILLKLCREESVKRLISGWNRAADGESEAPDCGEETPEGPPRGEDLHAGKLVGKATVIRRPSIAKLKALFEKGPAEAAPEGGRQRRPLFRSHSHYVGHALSVPDDAEVYSQQQQQFQESGHFDFSQLFGGARSPPCPNGTVSSKGEDPPVPPAGLEPSSKGKLQQSNAADARRDGPPELPVKKKPLERAAQDAVVPRFHVNVAREKQTDPSGKSSVQQEVPPGNAPTGKEARGSVGTASSSQERKGSEPRRECRRYSQDVDKVTLRKMQSFSDPEQSTGRCGDAAKQLGRPKWSLTDQPRPKLSFGTAEKANSEDKLSYLHETTYMNINSLAQKNIRQIENKLKSHPRGAIIDLTSRKSYMDETLPEKQHVFRNTVEPVQFVQKQESRDLTSVEKTQTVSAPGSQSDRAAAPKRESGRRECDDPNAKNLLLHSPPPKSKRGHASKPHAKSPSGEPMAAAPEPTVPSDRGNKDTTPPGQGFGSSPLVSPAADRSDPRYFPVHRQTAVDARYESEKHKAMTRNSSAVAGAGLYFFPASQGSIYQKLPVAYDKYTETFDKASSRAAAGRDQGHFAQKEPLYGLQRSTSGPQMLPPAPEAGPDAAAAANRSLPMYGLGEKSGGGLYGVFPPGPPKPPRTFHYELENGGSGKSEQAVRRDGGRYIVSVASPKHSAEPRRAPDSNPPEGHWQGSYGPPATEVHMSRSYPFASYERLYSHPRPYGKQFHGFRNVRPVREGIYGTAEAEPRQRATYADYENVRDAQRDYLRAAAAGEEQRRRRGGAAQEAAWEQRRSHDDMDLRPGPSARLREQIHARRSMVELDSLHISLAREGFPEGRAAAEKGTSVEGFSKMAETNPMDGMEGGKAVPSDNKKGAPSGPSFGETLSKAFGRLTSLTKFNSKDAQTSSSSSSESFVHVSKGGSKQKGSPSEQWTQV